MKKLLSVLVIAVVMACMLPSCEAADVWVDHWNDQYKYFSFTHSGKINVGYQDGHAAAKSYFAKGSISADDVFWASDKSKWYR